MSDETVFSQESYSKKNVDVGGLSGLVERAGGGRLNVMAARIYDKCATATKFTTQKDHTSNY